MMSKCQVLSLLIILALSLVGCSKHYGLTSQELENQIARELPVGTNKAKIVAFLDARQIEHSNVWELPPELLAEPQMDSFLNNPKLEGKRDRIKKHIAAKVPNVKYGFMTSFDIYLRFYLDGQDNLVDYVVDTIGTGP